jgi:hypothetical protein
MDALRKIGKLISDAFSSGSEKKSIEKEAILSLIGNSQMAVDAVLAINKAGIFSAYSNTFRTALSSPGFKTAYEAYSRALGYREPDGVLSSVYEAMLVASKDLEEIQEKFKWLFDSGTNEVDIDLDQIRVSHAATLGYIHNINVAAEWYCYMVSMVNTPRDLEKVPGYRPVFVVDNVDTVATLVKYIRVRGKKTFLGDMQAMSEKQHDVFLISNGKTFDTYTHEKDYSHNILPMFGGFTILTPFLWATDLYFTIGRMYYDRNKALRQWMLTKVSIIQMDLNKVDPESPEYVRLIKVLDSYSAMITTYDRKIAEYENRH